ncbi:MAG TPA: diguanylate cyclase [Thermoleophilaceae bacterium]|jgi:diguanylate cyclase (GGDEF)-like protein/putative nucleotidyltransferase with HDIG domain
MGFRVPSLARPAGGIEPTPRLAARAGALLFAGWAILGVVALPLRHGDQQTLGAALTALTALTAVALHLLARVNTPRWVIEAAPALGTALVSAQAYLYGPASSNVEVLYIWIALYVAYFLPREAAALQFAWIAIAYAAVLLPSLPTSDWALPWFQVVVTAALTGVLLRLVRESVVELVNRLANAAHTDPLTGLENRRGLEERIGTEVERALRHGRPLTLMIGDLDHFKRVNDVRGHRAGDSALVQLGEILTTRERRIDSVARTGGEEFTIVLPDTDEHEAYTVAERLRVEVEERFGDDLAPLTVSFGIAAYPDHGHTPEALLEAADQALYSAKALGRNRSVIFNREIASAFAPERARGLEGDIQLHTLLSLAEALDLRDTGTASHSRTVGRYCAIVARELGLPPERVVRIETAGVLHDIGKIGIPDAILAKPGRLTAVELREIRTHPEIGAQILSARGFEDIRAWVLAHHERPDGRGYPNGLSGGEIPLEARILAVADAYEAMTADRPYRTAVQFEGARAELLRCAGTQFDGRVVSALLSGLAREGEPADEQPPPPERRHNRRSKRR